MVQLGIGSYHGLVYLRGKRSWMYCNYLGDMSTDAASSIQPNER